MGCAQGAMGKMLMKEGTGTPTWGDSDPMMEFLREDLKRKRVIGVANTIRGTRSKMSSRARLGPYRFQGTIHMTCSPGDLALLLPWALGADASGTTFAVAESLQTFAVLTSRVTEVFEYQDCYINQLLLHGKAGNGEQPDFLTLSLQIFAKTRAVGVTFPSGAALSTTAAYAPYVHQDVVLTLESAAREVKEFWCLVNNHLQQRYVNSLTPTATCPSDRTVMLRTIHPYDTDHDDLLDSAVAGAAGTLAITNGAVSTSLAFANLRASNEDPEIEGKKEIDLELNMTAYATGTKEIIITNDSTP